MRLGEKTSLKKRKIKKAIARRAKAVDKYTADNAWRKFFVQAGILK
ncbi:DUF3983 domain-containing protein [Bacillus pseudomycoides]|nr:DUF3983 domain-containing protein [Bacillus pseudomycoides]PEE36087.1 DUF3983 domain-containing protein [Bacillus pseudomycoides]PGA87406.1 DUF3983 domain-containing protein [Bacillus pseudomycoides]PHF35350.1 DUF3983 domain-containing protein [Bacillus pseudomycoides]